ncbi:MAG: 23S rRNA (guanosine(2251)-2'-O)-methyltransferase RlmB [Flavobacteriales bacterium]|nr:23S rRNA (guanosine(2251)-2'-O)-methyltransferase RlmB [Flavobacteriales bacterium]
MEYTNKKEKTDNDLIYGFHPLLEAINQGKEINKIMIQKGLRGPLFSELNKKIKLLDIQLQHVPIEKLNRVCKKNHQGIIAYLSPIAYTSLDMLLPTIYEKGETPLLLILDQITDVRNFGAISRTAECAGVHGIILPAKGGVLITSDAIKVSSGALHKIPVCKTNSISETLQYIKDSGIQIVACTEHTEEAYHKVDFTVPTAIIMGSEESGISQEAFRLSDKKVKIPMVGEIESLNVSVAAGVILFETVKQRG